MACFLSTFQYVNAGVSYRIIAGVCPSCFTIDRWYTLAILSMALNIGLSC